jgi:hypothetical protein
LYFGCRIIKRNKMIRHPLFFILNLLFLTFLFSAPAYAQKVSPLPGDRDEVTWTGNTSDNWDEPGNWSNSAVPGEYTNVTIPAFPTGGVFPLVYAGTLAECKNLTIATGAVLSIRGFLTVHDEAFITDETSLAILSEESGTGSLIFNTENVVAVVQRYLSDGVNHFIGAPVGGATVGDLFFDNDPKVYLYRYAESTGDWATIADLEAPLLPGKGYSVYVEASGMKTDVTATFRGTVQVNDVHLSGDMLTYTGTSPYPGYNLVSNPFLSALSWDLGHWQADKVTGCIWLWNGEYNYLFRNAHGMGNLEGGIIPVSQAFMVKATGSNPSLTLSAEDRVHSNQNFYKKDGRDGDQYFVLEVSNGQKEDEVWVAFSQEGTEGYDTGWDTEKLYGIVEAPELYLPENGDEYSIDVFPLLSEEETRTIPMSFAAGTSGAYTVSLKELETGGKEGFRILLKDLQEGAEQLLTQNPVYQFNADVGDPPERFQIEVTKTADGIYANNATDYKIWASGKKVMVEIPDSAEGGELTIQITDLMGRVLVNRECAGDEKIILPLKVNHTYIIVRLWDDKTVVTRKLFIQ